MSHPDPKPGADEREPGVPPHQPEGGEQGEVEEGGEESFPSSDPPSTGGPGI
jgi:hypothetical protein